MKEPILSVLSGVVVVVVLTAPALAPSVTVKGNMYPNAIRVAGKTLELLGAGLREKWFLDIYTMGAYSESGTCDPRALISVDEIKYIRIDMLRDVSAEKMAGSLRRAFGRNTPEDASADLNAQINTFVSYFEQDLAKGSSMELTYVPAAGTTLRQTGEEQGTAMPGKAFADVLWSCYFSSKTCCPDLKAQILSHCSK